MESQEYRRAIEEYRERRIQVNPFKKDDSRDDSNDSTDGVQKMRDRLQSVLSTTWMLLLDYFYRRKTRVPIPTSRVYVLPMSNGGVTIKTFQRWDSLFERDLMFIQRQIEKQLSSSFGHWSVVIKPTLYKPIDQIWYSGLYVILRYRTPDTLTIAPFLQPAEARPDWTLYDEHDKMVVMKLRSDTELNRNVDQ
jgi:hypothetical protein